MDTMKAFYRGVNVISCGVLLIALLYFAIHGIYYGAVALSAGSNGLSVTEGTCVSLTKVDSRGNTVWLMKLDTGKTLYISTKDYPDFPAETVQTDTSVTALCTALQAPALIPSVLPATITQNGQPLLTLEQSLPVFQHQFRVNLTLTLVMLALVAITLAVFVHKSGSSDSHRTGTLFSKSKR